MENDMKINGEKCQILISNFSRDTAISPADDVTINNTSIPIVTSLKLLGVHITSDLKWDTHVRHITKTASRKLFMLSTLRQFNADQDDLRAIYISFIRPTLEYCSQLWHPGLTKQLSDDIERVQKRACRMIIGHDNFVNYDSACRQLNLDPLHRRRETAFGKLAADIVANTNHPLYPHDQDNSKPRPLRRLRRFVVPRAYTERYRTSVIPALIRTMNAL